MITNNHSFNHPAWPLFFVGTALGGYFFLFSAMFLAAMLIPMFITWGGFALGVGAYCTSSITRLEKENPNSSKIKALKEYESMPKEAKAEYGELNFKTLVLMREDQASVLHMNIVEAHTKYRLAQQELAKPAIQEAIQRSDNFHQLQDNRLHAYKELM